MCTKGRKGFEVKYMVMALKFLVGSFCCLGVWDVAGHLFEGLLGSDCCPEMSEEWVEPLVCPLWGGAVVETLAWLLLLYVAKGRDIDLRPRSSSSFLWPSLLSHSCVDRKDDKVYSLVYDKMAGVCLTSKWSFTVAQSCFACSRVSWALLIVSYHWLSCLERKD